MADKKITQLTNITGANLVDADEFVVVDISADETKAITLGELKEAFDSGSGFVRITGDTMTGDLALSGADVTFGDNDKAIFGAGSDLSIYHDPANGSIVKDNGTGRLLLDSENGTGISLTSGGIAKTMISATKDGDVKLYNNGSQKLATTSTGIDVTGTVTADGLTVGNGTQQARFYIDADEVSQLIDGNVRYDIWTGGDKTMRLDANGDISFYEDTGTTPKFFWDASAESLGIGTTTLTHNLEIREDINGIVGARITNPNSGSSAYSLLYFGTDNNAVHSGIFQNSSTNSNYGGANSLNIWTNSGSYPIAFHTNNTERLRIDSSGNVGIGTSSPSAIFNVSGPASSPVVAELETANSNADITLQSASSGSVTRLRQNTNDFQVHTNGSERLRIDSSGNLLVGTTDDVVSDTSGSGFSYQASSGYLALSRDTASDIAAVMYLNRTGDDGQHLQFRKDGSTVGSIGVDNSLTYITTNGGFGVGSGITFDSTGVLPTTRTGGVVDNAFNVGSSSYRFKDLYLSGGVFLGGTGSANKLDDYETGTWAPVSYNATTATYSHQSGSYVRVGDLVYIQGRLVMSSLGDGSSTRIGGLPFTQSEEATINVSKLANCSVSFYYFGLRVAGDTLYAHIQDGLDANITINNGFLGNTTEIQFSGTYRAV